LRKKAGSSVLNQTQTGVNQHVEEDPVVKPEYTEAIQQAAPVLFTTLRAHIDVVKDADNIDSIVLELVRDVGRQTSVQLMTATRQLLLSNIASTSSG